MSEEKTLFECTYSDDLVHCGYGDCRQYREYVCGLTGYTLSKGGTKPEPCIPAVQRYLKENGALLGFLGDVCVHLGQERYHRTAQEYMDAIRGALRMPRSKK